MKITNDYCGTTEAAEILGLSVTAVQKLIDSNELVAWKTNGGHRRTTRKSIEEFMQNRFFGDNKIIHQKKPELSVLIFDDDRGKSVVFKDISVRFDSKVKLLNAALVMDEIIDVLSIDLIALVINSGSLNGNIGFLINVFYEIFPFSHLIIIGGDFGYNENYVVSQDKLKKNVDVVSRKNIVQWLDGFISGKLFFV